MWNAQCNPYIQLHVIGAAPWNLSYCRFTRVCFGRTGNELRTDCRWSSRVASTDENGLPREKRGRNLTRDRRNRRIGFAGGDTIRARWEKVCGEKWGLPAG